MSSDEKIDGRVLSGLFEALLRTKPSLPVPPPAPLPSFLAQMVSPLSQNTNLHLDPPPTLPAVPSQPSSRSNSPMGIKQCEILMRFIMRRKIQVNGGRVLPHLDDLGILEGRKIRAAFLYSDLDGFTKIVASKPPEVTLVLHQAFVELLSRITTHYDGTVVNCAGDRILSVFDRGENDPSPEPIRQAITAALWMQTILQRVVSPELRTLGVNENVSAAMGIDYGLVVAGCVGTRNNKHFEFFGNAANNAAKLQEIGNGNEIVISRVAFQSGPEFLKNGTWHPIDEVSHVRLMQRFADHVISPPTP